MDAICMLAESYLHRLDPVIVELWGGLAIRWYGFSYLMGFIVAWVLLIVLSRTGRIAITKRQVGDYMMYVIAGVIVGGRLGYVLFYDITALWTFTDQLPFWELLAFNKGGMSSHGGVIGVILVTILFADRRGISRLHVLDIASFACPFGLCFGRVANFINAELWGEPLPASMQASPPWWSVKYPDELLHPDFDQMEIPASTLADVRAELLLNNAPGEEVWVEATRAMAAGNETVINLIQPHLNAYYPSQLIQALTDGPLLLGILILVWLVPRKPGVIGATFMLSYGVMRMASELLRQPDEGVDMWFGLSRGQWLSIPMILTGVIGGFIVMRRAVPRMGGLLKPADTNITMRTETEGDASSERTGARSR